MAKAKISSKDFLDLLDEQNDQPTPVLGSLIQGKGDRAQSKSDITGNKATTNREQTDNKVGTQPATKRQQTGNTQNALTVSDLETGNKVGTQPATLSATKRQQTENKLATIVPFSSLVGLQRAIMLFLYDACKTARGRATAELTLEHIGACLNTSSGSAKTTLQRLENKGCIVRIGFKNGRGGWSKYELPEAVFREMLQLETENKLATNWGQSGNKVGTQPATQPATSVSSSSSSIELEDLKTTTTGELELFEDSRFQLTPEWAAIDTSPLSEIGFTQTHLIQVARQGKLIAVEVESSIEFFAFDLKQNNKAKALNGSPLNFFMGILRKGIPYAPPENYESPADEVRRRTREILERKERERQADEKRIQDLEFMEWRQRLSVDEGNRLLPEFARKPGQLQEITLRSHFETHVWPARAVQLLASSPEIEPRKEDGAVQDYGPRP